MYKLFKNLKRYFVIFEMLKTEGCPTDTLLWVTFEEITSLRSLFIRNITSQLCRLHCPAILPLSGLQHWVASATQTHVLTILEARVQEQGALRIGFRWDLSPWLADGFLLCVLKWSLLFYHHLHFYLLPSSSISKNQV